MGMAAVSSRSATVAARGVAGEKKDIIRRNMTGVTGIRMDMARNIIK